MVELLGIARDAETGLARLLALLDVWRVWPHPDLVELIALARRRALGDQEPIVLAERRDAQQVQWLAVAQRRNPVTLDWLVEHLVTAQSGASKLRIHELEGWAPDPGIALGLLEAARSKPLTSRQNRPFWTQLFRIVHQQLHAGAAPLVAELLQMVRITEFDSLFRTKLAHVQTGIARLPRVPAPTAEEAAILVELAARLGLASERDAEQTADDFLREIWQNPADDGPREVFADWLQERGDVWGELITLQIARARQGPGATKSRRERALLDEHARNWLGPLEPVVVSTNIRFERGFLYSCKVHWRRLAAAPALMIHPAWATVHWFEIEHDGERPCAAWMDHVIALGARRR